MSPASPDWSLLRRVRTAGPGRETAHVFVRETVRIGILNGMLSPGTRLVQSDLARNLEVSTTPVREALRDLASEGLIRIDPHRGGIVSDLDLTDMEEIYMLRQRLEPLAIELAVPHITPALIASARKLHSEMSDAPDSAAWVELNREFHLTLCTPCGRPRLLGMVQNLQDASVMVVSNVIQTDPDIRRQANLEHGQLVDAIEAGDVETSKAIVLEHITISLRALSNGSTG